MTWDTSTKKKQKSNPKPWADPSNLEFGGKLFLYWIYLFIQIAFKPIWPKGLRFSLHFIFVLFFFSVALLMWFTGTGESEIVFSREWQFILFIISTTTLQEYVCVSVCRCAHSSSYRKTSLISKLPGTFAAMPTFSLLLSTRSCPIHTCRYLHKHRSICRSCIGAPRRHIARNTVMYKYTECKLDGE